MRAQTMSSTRTRRQLTALAVLAALAAAWVLLGPAQGAQPAAAGPARDPTPVTLEKVPGTGVKRVTLSPRAAERLGLRTGVISEETIVRRQMVSGLVTSRAGAGQLAGHAPGQLAGLAAGQAQQPPPRIRAQQAGAGLFSGFAQAARPLPIAQAAPPPRATPAMTLQGGAAPLPRVAEQPAPATAPPLPLLEDAWVLVTLSSGEWERLAQDKPARLLPLLTREARPAMTALPSGVPPAEDFKRSMLSLYYVVAGKDHGLTLNSRMRVELEVAGGAETHKVVPYGAVYYDGKGNPWIYVRTRPLTFERQRISVERIEGDKALLSAGPPSGTTIVTVGAALLYGSEIFGK